MAVSARADRPREAARARGGVLRPRQDADGGVLGHLLRPGGLRDGDDLARAAGARRLREPALPPARLDRRPRRRGAQARRGDDRRRARARPRAPSPRVLAGVLPRLYPQMLERAYAHQDAGRARLHPHRRLAGDGRPARARARLRRRPRLALGDRRRPLHRPRRPGRSTTARARCSRCASSPSARASTWPPPTPTRTPSPTCRCCAPSATRSSSTPTPTCAGSPREEGWEIVHLDRLGRRLKIARRRCAGTAAALGGLGGRARSAWRARAATRAQ